MEEAGVLRGGPAGPDQQWPTVSSATAGKDVKIQNICEELMLTVVDLLMLLLNFSSVFLSLSEDPQMSRAWC